MPNHLECFERLACAASGVRLGKVEVALGTGRNRDDVGERRPVLEKICACIQEG